MRRLGELSRELEKAQTVHKGKESADIRLPTNGKSKELVLKEAGISTSQAHRCEKLAAMPEKKFEEQISKGRTATDIMRSDTFNLIHDSLVETFCKFAEGEISVLSPWHMVTIRAATIVRWLSFR